MTVCHLLYGILRIYVEIVSIILTSLSSVDIKETKEKKKKENIINIIKTFEKKLSSIVIYNVPGSYIFHKRYIWMDLFSLEGMSSRYVCM